MKVPAAHLKAALLPCSLEVLRHDDLPVRRRGRGDICQIFGWMGTVAVPHLVAWIVLLERPLKMCLQWRAEALRRDHDNARVRLAAKNALNDKGGESVARTNELNGL